MHPLGVIAGLGGSVLLHLIFAVVVAGMPVRRDAPPQAPVELEVQPEPPPPPPPPPVEPEPEPEKQPEPKRLAPPPRAVAAPKAAVPRPAAAPTAAAPPVFGVDMTDTSPDGTVAAPVGNTTMTEPSRRGPLKPGPVAVAPPPPPPPPPPVTIKELPEVLAGPPTDGYPTECEDAERAGVEGVVRLAVVVLDSGRVGEVKLVKGIDRCLDSAAVRLMREIKFKPAMGSDGKPQRYRIGDYRFRFRINR